MSWPYNIPLGNGSILIDASSLSLSNQYVDVCFSMPCSSAYADILNALGIKTDAHFDTVGRPKYKFQSPGTTDMKMGLSFAMNGVGEGRTVKVVVGGW